MKRVIDYTKLKNKMSTYNLNIEECSGSQFPIELITFGNQIYKGLDKLGKTASGVFVLLPVYLSSIILLPVMYVFISLALYYYLIKLDLLHKKILKVQINKESYSDFYELHLFLNNHIKELSRIKSKQVDGKAALLFRPVLFFINKFHVKVSSMNRFLESQLFEKREDLEISNEDIDFFCNQLRAIDHDWDDDEIWADFQTQHHHKLSV